MRLVSCSILSLRNLVRLSATVSDMAYKSVWVTREEGRGLGGELARALILSGEVLVTGDLARVESLDFLFPEL